MRLSILTGPFYAFTLPKFWPKQLTFWPVSILTAMVKKINRRSAFWPKRENIGPEKSIFWPEQSKFWPGQPKIWPELSKFWPIGQSFDRAAQNSDWSGQLFHRFLTNFLNRETGKYVEKCWSLGRKKKYWGVWHYHRFGCKALSWFWVYGTIMVLGVSMVLSVKHYHAYLLGNAV